MPAPILGTKGTSARQDMSVILVTGSYDHEIRFWEAWSGICSRTIARSGESGVSTPFHQPSMQCSDTYSPLRYLNSKLTDLPYPPSKPVLY